MAMTAQQYTRWTRWWRTRPRAVEGLLAVNRVLTYLCYLLYPLLLVLAALTDAELFARVFLVPFSGFVAVSLVRRAVNAPRPYEALDIEALMRKDTRGRSFPSRHVFSIFVIAASWSLVSVPLGIALGVSGCLMAAIRVLGGVHFPRDVIAGAACALVWCAIWYGLLPW